MDPERIVVRKVIKAKIVGLTARKRRLLESEYENLQKFLKGDKNVELYSANRQQAFRFYHRIIGKAEKEYPISVRKDLVQVERRRTKLAKYWFRVRVRGWRKLWVAIKPNMKIPEGVRFCESKILRKEDDFFVHLAIEKEVALNRAFKDVLAIDFGIRHIASVVRMSTMKPIFYDNGLKKTRGHYYHLRKALGMKKALKTIRKVGHTERRKVNDILHKISRDIVDSAKETDSMIAFGRLTGIRKNGRGKRFGRKLNSFPYYRLAQYIRYKAEWEGIMVVEVSEAYTSKTCHLCGELGERKAGSFRCRCGLQDDADRNGAINIGSRALGHVSEVGAVSEPARNLTNFGGIGEDDDPRFSRETVQVGW